MIAIVFATIVEAAPFMERHGITPELPGRIGGTDVILSVTGVGCVAATYSITRIIYRYHPDMVIQAGIAGSYPLSGLGIGESVVVSGERIADIGTHTEAGLRRIFSAGERLACDILPEGFAAAEANTVNTACTPFADSTGVGVESMEGYALFYVCRKENVPFIELRTISNVVGDDRSLWNIPLATGRLSDDLGILLSGIKPGCR